MNYFEFVLALGERRHTVEQDHGRSDPSVVLRTATGYHPVVNTGEVGGLLYIEVEEPLAIPGLEVEPPPAVLTINSEGCKLNGIVELEKRSEKLESQHKELDEQLAIHSMTFNLQDVRFAKQQALIDEMREQLVALSKGVVTSDKP